MLITLIGDFLGSLNPFRAFFGVVLMLKSKLSRVGAVVGGVVLASPAFADGPDFTTLTGAIDMSTVTTAVMAVGAVMVGVYVAIKGAKIVLQMVRGA